MPPCTPLPALALIPALATIADMGQRIRTLCDDFDRLDREGDRVRYAKRRVDAERHALSELVLLHQAATLADAAVQANCAYGEAEMLATDARLAPELHKRAERLRRSVASIAVAICRATGSDPDHIAWGGMRVIHAREFGGAVPEAAAAEDADTGLIGWCEELVTLDREAARREAGMTPDQEARIGAELAPVRERIDALVMLIAGAAPSTREGERAMAKAVAQLRGDNPTRGLYDEITLALIGSMAEQAAASGRGEVPHADAAVLEACREFLATIDGHGALIAAQDAASEAGDKAGEARGQAAIDAMYGRRDELQKVIAGTRAKTAEAQQAKARLLARYLDVYVQKEADADEPDRVMMWSLLRDLVGENRTVQDGPVTEQPDAELIRLGQEAAALNVEVTRVYDGAVVRTPEWQAAFGREQELCIRRIAIQGALQPSTPAATLAGLRAKAETIRSAVECGLERQNGPTAAESALAWSVVQDVLRLVFMPATGAA